MGFYFRKSVKFGPMRFNFSKSGISVSAGVKGARISMGPRGTYVHAGVGGFYYRQRIGGSNFRSQNSYLTPAPQIYQWQEAPVHAVANHYVIETADVSQLVDTSSEELLSQINSAATLTRSAPFAFIGTFVISILLLFLPSLIASVATALGLPIDDSLNALIMLLFFVVAAATCIAGLILSWKIHKGDELKRTTPLFYELEPDAQSKFTAIQQACEALSRSARVWRIQTEQPTWDRRRNAGASSLITRHPVFITRQPPPFIATNVDVWSIKLNDFALFFMPDYVFVLQRGKYGAVSYNSLSVSFSPTRFIEDQGVPPDSQVLEYTWRYVNKNGSPDRRFSNNAQIPVVQYGFVALQSHTGLNLHLNVSQVGSAKYFSEAINYVLAQSQQFKERQSNSSQGQSKEPIKTNPDSKTGSAYEILGVPFDATAEQITAAYYQMAKMYHPDKLVNLAPEFTELAEERMKEINLAYETLNSRT